MAYRYCLVALCASVLTALAMWRGPNVSRRALLENARVRVVEVTSPRGGVRPRGVRATDQVIVFLDDCRYQRTDPQSGAKTIRTRRSGDVIWHSKGEAAPQLVNAGPAPYRTLVVELK